MADSLYRYAQYRGCDVFAAEGSLQGYQDAEGVSRYARNAMQWYVREGLITGVKSDLLTPDGTATRAQVATILMRFCQGFTG